MDVLHRYSNKPYLLHRVRHVLQQIRDGGESTTELVVVEDEKPLDGPQSVEQRLGPAGIQALVDLRRAGTTIRELAEKFGIGTTSVKRILREHGVRRYKRGSGGRS